MTAHLVIDTCILSPDTVSKLRRTFCQELTATTKARKTLEKPGGIKTLEDRAVCVGLRRKEGELVTCIAHLNTALAESA